MNTSQSGPNQSKSQPGPGGNRSTFFGGVTDTSAASTSKVLEFRQPDLKLVEAELQLLLPEVRLALESLEESRVVSQDTLEFKFSV